jgi:2-deoxy-D-gluconate 3-dehydrogenase
MEVKRSIELAGGQAHIFVADITQREDLDGLGKRVSELLEGTKLNLVLVNSAGVAFTRPAMEVTESDWDKVLGVHVKGTFFCSQLLARLMIDRGYGKIINLSSTWAASTDSGKSVYGSAKAAVSYMTAALSTEWAPQGVRVNAIAPSKTTGESWQTKQHNPARNERLLGRIKLGRFADPSDMVGAAIFLASHASDFVTGQTLFVDGGFNAAG